MADRSYTALANSSGIATATVNDGPNKGICWVVAQFSVETLNVFRAGATATIRRNGRFITSTNLGSSDTAYGPPSIVIVPGDIVTCVWGGLTLSDQGVFTLWYDEQPTSAKPNPDFVV